MEDRTRALRAFANRLHEAIYSPDRGATNPRRLAAALGGEPSESTIRSWLPPDVEDPEGAEIGKRPKKAKPIEPTEPTAILLAMVAEKLNVSVDWLLFGSERQALDLALVRKLRSLRTLHESALTKELGTQLSEEQVSMPLAGEIARDVQLVDAAQLEAIVNEVREIMARAPALMRELEHLEKQWKELRKRYPATSTRRR